MASRDYTSDPASKTFNLETVINGLSSDLEALRKGEISITDGMARAMLGKQIFNGVRLHLNAMKLFSDGAKDVTPPTGQIEGDKP